MSNEDIQNLMKSQQKVFIALATMTIISVGVAMAGSGGTLFILIAIGIALVQSFLILGTLMHVKESSPMRGLLALTFFLAGFLLFASWLAFSDHIDGTESPSVPVVAESHAESDGGDH